MKNNILKSIPPTTAAPQGEPERFIAKFGRALHRYGLPSHRIESALQAVSERLGFAGQFFATPTAIFASLEREETERTILIRVDPGEIQLDKLSRLDRLLMRLISGEIPPDEASRKVDAIVDAPARYGRALTVTAFATGSAAASRFFGGGWHEFAVCGVIGMVTGMLALLAQRFPGRFGAFEALAAFSAGVLAAIAGALLVPTSVYVATCAGLIVLIPGLSLTIGITELATRNLVAGTSRLTNALIVMLFIGFGVAVGLKTGALIFGPAEAVEPATLPGWTLPLALLLAAASLTVLFQAHPRDAGWIAASGAIAYIGARLGAQLGGIEFGALTGALVLGLSSNLHARVINRPAIVTLVPGMILLVPGSIGFQSLSSLVADDVVSGMHLAFTMGLAGVALVTGLLLAGSIISPRRSL